jgi:hypothetical protein
LLFPSRVGREFGWLWGWNLNEVVFVHSVVEISHLLLLKVLPTSDDVAIVITAFPSIIGFNFGVRQIIVVLGTQVGLSGGFEGRAIVAYNDVASFL